MLYNINTMSKRNVHKSMMSGENKCPIDEFYNGPLVRHHINGRNVQNADGDWNIVYVSPNTHRLIHEGEVILEGWFQSTSGRILLWHKKNEPSITGRDTHPHIIIRDY